MQFQLARQSRQPEHRFQNWQQAYGFWRDLAGFGPETPKLSLRSDQALDLLRFLERLVTNAEYQNQTVRPFLAQRVIDIMALLTDPVRENALNRIHHAISSCDDRVILALDDLETLQLRTSAETMALEQNDPRALRTLGQQMVRLDEVKRIAQNHMKNYERVDEVDEVEVELAFQIGVRNHLDLPGATQLMFFINRAKISDQDIANAVDQVREKCSGVALERYLDDWGPWQKYQRHQTIRIFDQLQPQTVPRIEDCPICGHKTDQMVAVDNHQVDYDALCRAYLENGKNPFTNTPLDWLTVVRLIEDSSTNS